MKSGYLYFYIHFVTEVVCFFALSRIMKDSLLLWMIPFMYDAMAFVPQSIIGYINDLYPKINMGLIGVFLLTIGFILYFTLSNYVYVGLVIMALGNAFIHVRGAEVTLRSANGKLSPSAIFVSGGSFGVITGKLLGGSMMSIWLIVIMSLTMIPFTLLAEYYNKNYKTNELKLNFKYHNKSINPGIVIICAVFIVIVRGYMGYGIPTSWNKTVLQTILLYVSMGIGKALGGILSDIFGIRKIALLSVIFAIPFLLFGDNIMLISLIGIIMFSMTMSITLALLVSVLKDKPGLAFGLTTIGLFLGTAPIFFVKVKTFWTNASIILVFSIICYLIFLKIIKKDDVDGNNF